MVSPRHPQRKFLIESPGCTKCAAAERILNDFLDENPNLNLVNFYYYSDEGHCIIKEKGIKGDIPAIVIGNSVINYDDYNGDEEKLRKLIDEALVSQEAIKIDSQGNNDRRYNQSYTNLYGREPDLGNLSLSSIVAVLFFLTC